MNTMTYKGYTAKVEYSEDDGSYPGRMMVRVAPDLHAKATLAAKTAGKSLNQWVS